MNEFNWKPNEMLSERLARLPGNMVRYAVNLQEMADGKRACYKEIISLCKMFDIDYDAGDSVMPFWIIPAQETNVRELEQFMHDMNIPYTKHAHLH